MDPTPQYTVSINPLRMLATVLQTRGFSVSELLKRHEIDPAELDDLEARVPLHASCAVWDEAAQLLKDPSIGITVGAQEPIGEGLLAYAVQASNTVGDAFQEVVRFHRLITDVIEPLLVEERGRVRIRLSSPLPEPEMLRHLTELYLAKFIYTARTLTGVDSTPLAVRFRHARPARVDAYRAFFRAPLTFGHVIDELEIDRAVLLLPVRTAQPRLLQILDRYAAEALARLPPANDFVQAVRFVVATALRSEEPTLDRLATRFHVTPRTLQRRLAEAGLSLRRLVDDVRHELALRYLERDDLSLGEIGFLLGFDAKQSFHRAFRRWTGATPAEMRRRRQPQAAD
jgi:AraC-like DNA-binding protein